MDIAKAFLIEANNDYDAVSILLENEKFNLATYHAQQAVEKLLKPKFDSFHSFLKKMYPLFSKISKFCQENPFDS